jgi:beta-lactamase class A
VNATVRSTVAIAALFSALPGLSPIAQAEGVAAAPGVNQSLQAQLEQLSQRASPGVMGISVFDLQTGTQWSVNATRAYPMMSVFKAPIGATVLDIVDRGQITPDQTVSLTRADLRKGASAIRDSFHGTDMTFTVQQLLVSAVSHSDNTAADALVKLVGGPTVITAFLRQHGIEGMRVDLDEGQISDIFNDLTPGMAPAANETAQHRDQRLRRGYAAYLADPRNRTTPDAAVDFLRRLWAGQLLSHDSTQRLQTLMYRQTVPRRLRNGFPADVRVADKCGTSESLEGVTAAYNDRRCNVAQRPHGDGCRAPHRIPCAASGAGSALCGYRSRAEQRVPSATLI